MNKQGGAVVWEERWQALERILQSMLEDAWPSPSFKALIACLDAFGSSQFNFFYDGFQSSKFWPSTLYPVDYVLGTILKQVSYDITVIKQAAEPRDSDHKIMAETLHKADQLAQLALNLAVENKLLKESTVICYFNKSAYIRTIPYAPLALVAVPYTSTTVSRDFLATPHEIGHHVYRHSPGLLAELSEKTPIQPDWCNQWHEEIFADVYGCLVAGPVIGLDFQDLLLDHSLENFLNDDGEHPVEAIRPYAYVKVLAELGFPKAAKALRKRWDKKRKARNSPETFIPYGDFSPVSLAEAREELERFALAILNYLTEVKMVESKDYWSKDLGDGEKLNSLYQKFDEWVNGTLDVVVPELREEGAEVGVLVDGELVNKRHKGATQTWIDDLKQINGHKLPPEAWTPVISSDGWNVGGPGTDWPP